MKITRAAVAVCAVSATLAFANHSVFADQVDDLLAGKPVLIAEEDPADKVVAEIEREFQASLGDRVIVQESKSLDGNSEKSLSDNSWQVSLDEPSHVGLEHQPTAPPDSRPGEQAASLSVVPEPSAVALAALSLVYFLIFFRRRYAF